ncbi:hypothetical protein S40285_03780 [Stachybotrys chlorohalonatus IBT 40285]|uniref:Uncharacterized protein n=1 Tax=Stachybotrys chlorohalonatus (strain IBT 40285) TaxID=1283841 RepID=A0A084QIZ7_STAC4|nr:hypothetical protein S40285_03780 [Stachybotrys chlorohalonata IBT 40285]
MTPNPFLLAADDSPALLPLLREKPSLASAQDDHGYSLIHAAASYNHLNLLRALVHEFGVDVNLKDEDDETGLFVVETLEAAKVLVEELGVDIHHKGSEGLTARQKIELENEFPAVAAYLATLESLEQTPAPTADTSASQFLPPPPEGLPVTISTVDENEILPEVEDTEFRQRIEALAQRDDFDTPQGQFELRKLVEEALVGQGLGDERSVRAKKD